VPTPPAAQDNGFNFINNQNLFSIRQLSPGQHNLVVTYTGNTRTIPIGFSYFIQEDETSSTSLTTSTGVPSGTSSSSSPSSSTPTGNHRTPTDAIIGGVIGGLVLIFLLLALFFFNRRRKNWIPQALSEMSHTVPSPDVVNPFTSPSSNPNSTITFLPQKYTSKGQSIPSHFISSKFSHQRGEPSDPASTVAGTSSGSGIPTLTPLRRQFSSPALQFPPSGSSPLRALPLTGFESQTNLDDCTRTRVPQAATEPSIRSPSLQEPNVRFLQHDDSGVRMPAASEDEVQVVELPPVYSPE
jgi:hypothetical protein